jgi:hypothetical protein
MFRNTAFAAIYVAFLVFLTAALARSADYGTAEEARATLDKAVAAVKADKAKALDMFNKGEGGFKDRDLYVFCANALDGVITAHPTHKGEQLADIKGKKGFPLGQEMMKNATEGKVSEVRASPWLGQAARKDLVLHEGRRPDLRRRLLQVNRFTAV